MKNEKKLLRILAACSVAGALFAGYLSGTKLLTSTCAFNEPCPYVLGYPACFYGFALFLTLAVVSVAGALGRMRPRTVARVDAAVAGVGIVFAGWLTTGEVLSPSASYSLGLPTCAYGLVFYVIVFWAALSLSRVAGKSA